MGPRRPKTKKNKIIAFTFVILLLLTGAMVVYTDNTAEVDQTIIIETVPKDEVNSINWTIPPDKVVGDGP